MYFISTRGGEKVTGAEAIVQGLAKDGGLYVPEKFPKIRHYTGDFMILDDKSLRFTTKGFFVSNHILSEILHF